MALYSEETLNTKQANRIKLLLLIITRIQHLNQKNNFFFVFFFLKAPKLALLPHRFTAASQKKELHY